MKTLAHLLTVVALTASFAVAADETKPAAGDKPKRDPEVAYKKLDANSDGAVSLDEFKASPRGKQDPAKADEAFKRRDADGNGSLSLDEFKASAGKGGKKKKDA